MKAQQRAVTAVFAVALLVGSAACGSSSSPRARGVSSAPPSTVNPSAMTYPSSSKAGPVETPSAGVESVPPQATASVCATPPAAEVSATPLADPNHPGVWATVLCVQAHGTIHLSLPSYPGGWQPLTINPVGAAKVSQSAKSNGSASATVTVSGAGSFTIGAATGADLAMLETWTIAVTAA